MATKKAGAPLKAALAEPRGSFWGSLLHVIAVVGGTKAISAGLISIGIDAAEVAIKADVNGDGATATIEDVQAIAEETGAEILSSFVGEEGAVLLGGLDPTHLMQVVMLAKFVAGLVADKIPLPKNKVLHFIASVLLGAVAKDPKGARQLKAA